MDTVEDEDERDRALMLAAKMGDVQAFTHLAGLYRVPLQHFFRSLLGDATGAEDAAQEVLLRLWTLRGRYEPTGRFSHFLFTLARNHYRNVRERRRYRAGHEAVDGDADLLPAPEPAPEVALLNRLDREAWQAAIDALPPIYRNVFVLSHTDGLRYAEIAAHLEIPIGTVKSRMAQAVKRLRQTLRDRNPEGEE